MEEKKTKRQETLEKATNVAEVSVTNVVEVSATNVAEITAKISELGKALAEEKEGELLWWLTDELSRVHEVCTKMYQERKRSRIQGRMQPE